jgi:hypothetical protein
MSRLTPKRKSRPRKGVSKLGVSGQATPSNGSEVHIRRTELAAPITIPAGTAQAPKTTGTGNINVSGAAFTHLLALCGVYERIRWNKLSFRYVPAVGTTYGGLVAYGADYTRQTNSANLGVISALTPNTSHAAWANSPRPLVIPKERLMTKIWYDTSASTTAESPCQLDWFVQGQPNETAANVLVGYLYVDYDVTLTGTKA